MKREDHHLERIFDGYFLSSSTFRAFKYFIYNLLNFCDKTLKITRVYTQNNRIDPHKHLVDINAITR